MMGFTTIFCFVAAVIFRLNHAVIQGVNYLMAPVQLLLLPIFIAVGERFSNDPLIVFNFGEITKLFFHHPGEFFTRYGFVVVRAIGVWAITAPFAICVIFFVVRGALRPLTTRHKDVPPDAIPLPVKRDDGREN